MLNPALEVKNNGVRRGRGMGRGRLGRRRVGRGGMVKTKQ
jgi:hypothetical protein